MSTGLNIAAISRRTGVGADTLRKWEQRYGILRPSRTSGGQRRYSESDVARVQWLNARLGEGYRIGEAANLLGHAASPAPETLEALLGAAVDALRQNASHELERLLDHAFTIHPLAGVMKDVVIPLFERTGDAWARGTVEVPISIAQEHLLTAAVRARLSHLLADSRGGVRGVAVLTCPPEERHDVGLLTLAVVLRADGWQVAFTGVDTPVDSAVALAESLSARILCFSAMVPERIDAIASGLEEVGLPHDLEIVLGGPGATTAAAERLGGRHVEGELAEIVGEIRVLAA